MKNFEKHKLALETELAVVEKELKTLGQKNPDNPRDWETTSPTVDTLASDQSDVADHIEAYEENMAILNKLEGRYNNVKDALKRIQDGTYGVCKICKKPIEEKRLEANPAAETCIEHINS